MKKADTTRRGIRLLGFLAFLRLGEIQAQIQYPIAHFAWNTTITNLTDPLLAADRADHFIVAGTTQNNSANFWVGAFGDHARLLWSASFDGTAHLNDAVTALTTDSSNNVLVAGSSVSGTSLTNLALVKYTTSGTQQWARAFPGLQITSAGLGTDAAGDIYAARTLIATNGLNAVATVKWDANGNLLWNRTYPGTNATSASANGLAVDPAGDCFVLVTRLADQVVLKYNPDGLLVWQSIDSNTVPAFIRLDGSNNIYTSGSHLASQTTSNSNFNLVTLKMDGFGNVLWRNEDDGSQHLPPGILSGAQYYCNPTGFAIDGDANVYTVVRESIASDNPPEGLEEWRLGYSGQGVFTSGRENPGILNTPHTNLFLTSSPSGLVFESYFTVDQWNTLAFTPPLLGGADYNLVWPLSVEAKATLCDTFGNLVLLGSGPGNSTYLEKEVFAPPQWPSTPTNQTVASGTDVIISGQATGTELNVEWALNGNPLTNGTSLGLTLKSVVTNQAGAYQVLIGNPAGTLSAWVHLIVDGWSPSYFIAPQTSVSGGVNVLHYGKPGGVYELDGTSDLLHWSAVGGFTNDVSGQYQVQIPANTSTNMQFYRMRLIR